MGRLGKIKQNYQDFIDGIINYLPFPDLGEFTKAFPGLMRGETNCWTGTPASSKTSFLKFLLIHWGIKIARKLGLDYKIIWFHLEESDEQFEYSLLSNALYEKSNRRIRKNIRDFEFVGGSVGPEDFDLIEQADKRVSLMLEYIEHHENPYNTTGIYNKIRAFARKRGKFFLNGRQLTDEEVNANSRWDKYVPDNPKEFIVIVLDHILLVNKESNQANVHEAIWDTVEKLRSMCAKQFNYCVNIVQHQDNVSENQESRKNMEVLPTLQGLGKNKEVNRSYLNVIGITDLNRTNANGTGSTGVQIWDGGVSVPKMGRFMRVVNIMKNRYGTVDVRESLFSDGKVAHFELLDRKKLDSFYTRVKQLNESQ